jgi:glutamyl/glutaminyl-tRNA synthetase
MITRFNPTCNGLLHLGHLYIALVNYHEAKQAGGEFILRLDDDQPGWVASVGHAQMQHFGFEALETLKEFGMQSDRCYFQSAVNDIEGAPPYVPEPFPAPIDPLAVTQSWYSYTPHFTYCKVVMDNRDGVTDLIRGVDLLSEYSLYQYYTELSGYPAPKQYYLPRLVDHHGLEISKTNHAAPVSNYLGWLTPDQIISRLADCVLNVPALGWRMFNVKRFPTLAKNLF